MLTIFPIEVPTIVLVGPTAIGKTTLSILLAKRFNCEIISMDSMQVYRYMDIGTAKIKEEEKEGVPHYLIDIVDPDEDYDAGRFVQDCFAAIESIQTKGKNVLLTGGTGLYLKALIDGLADSIPADTGVRQKLKRRLEEDGADNLFEELMQCDPETAGRIHKNDHYRLLRGLEIYYLTGKRWSEHINRQQQGRAQRFSHIIEIGLTCSRDRLYERINRRTELMFEEGLEGEVLKLLEMGYHSYLKSMKSLGYRHMVNYLDGNWSLDETKRLLARDTRHYAKRQYTWFNKSPALSWFEVSKENKIMQAIDRWFAEVGQ